MINLKDYNINLHLIKHDSYIPTSVGGWRIYLNKIIALGPILNNPNAFYLPMIL